MGDARSPFCLSADYADSADYNGVTPIHETVVRLHTWLTKDFAFQSNHRSTELRPAGEAEVSSAGEQLTKE